MTLNDYQSKAMSTCMPSCDNFSYMMLNLVGELGELASKIAKAIRKDQVGILGDDLKLFFGDYMRAREFEEELLLELGDILWQLAGVCKVLGLDLEDVAKANLEKLASRQDRGVIDGNGDHR